MKRVIPLYDYCNLTNTSSNRLTHSTDKNVITSCEIIKDLLENNDNKIKNILLSLFEFQSNYKQYDTQLKKNLKTIPLEVDLLNYEIGELINEIKNPLLFKILLKLSTIIVIINILYFLFIIVPMLLSSSFKYVIRYLIYAIIAILLIEGFIFIFFNFDLSINKIIKSCVVYLMKVLN